MKYTSSMKKETIKLLIEIKVEKNWIDSHEEKDWFFTEILSNKIKHNLILYSNEIGDEISEVKVLRVLTP